MKKLTTKNTNTTVYISNLSYKRDRNGLKSMFSRFGVIKNIKIVVEPTTNQSRGMAFVEMGSVTEATNAITNLNQQIVDGRTVKATWATPLRSGSFTKTAPAPEKKAKIQKDLDYKAIQLAKKARNDKKKRSNPFSFVPKAK
ncbi:MAG: RNA recognition motif domain-containing protein [Bacteriovoracia bacterium]